MIQEDRQHQKQSRRMVDEGDFRVEMGQVN